MVEASGAGRVHVPHDEVVAISRVVETSATEVHDVAATVAGLLREGVVAEAARLCPGEAAEAEASLEDVARAVTATGWELEGVARLARLCLDGYREVDHALARLADELSGRGQQEPVAESSGRSSYPLLDAALAHHDGGSAGPGATLYDDPWLERGSDGSGAAGDYESAVVGLAALDGLHAAG